MSDIICSRPECQTTAGCQCRKPFGVNFTWGHVKDLQSAKIRELEDECLASMREIAALRSTITVLEDQHRNAAAEARKNYLAHVAQIAALLKVCAENGLREQALTAIRAFANQEQQP